MAPTAVVRTEGVFATTVGPAIFVRARSAILGENIVHPHLVHLLFNQEYLFHVDHLGDDPQVQTARPVQERNLSLCHRLEWKTLHDPGQILALLDLLDGAVEYICSWGKHDQNLTVFASHPLYSLYHTSGMSKPV